MGQAKKKVSVTISADLLAELDDVAKRQPGATRSSVLESWLRRSSQRLAAKRLEEETLAYYRGRTTRLAKEDASWSRAASRQLAGRDRD